MYLQQLNSSQLLDTVTAILYKLESHTLYMCMPFVQNSCAGLITMNLGVNDG